MDLLRQATSFYVYLRKILPFDHPDLGVLHKNLGEVLRKRNLHNNLAACYQDLNDDQSALHHYRSSLDILSPDEEHKSMHAAIIHYNLALIYTNCNELNEARIHLHKSLLHFSGSSENKNSRLDVAIYIAFSNTYERCNDWQMARDYYQRAIDQVKQNAPDHPNIIKYQKRLQYIIDKINVST